MTSINPNVILPDGMDSVDGNVHVEANVKITNTKIILPDGAHSLDPAEDGVSRSGPSGRVVAAEDGPVRRVRERAAPADRYSPY